MIDPREYPTADLMYNTVKPIKDAIDSGEITMSHLEISLSVSMAAISTVDNPRDLIDLCSRSQSAIPGAILTVAKELKMTPEYVKKLYHEYRQWTDKE